MVAERDRPLADGGPDPAADRLQAETVLVRGPDLDRPVGMRRPGLGDGFLEPLTWGASLSRARSPAHAGGRRRAINPTTRRDGGRRVDLAVDGTNAERSAERRCQAPQPRNARGAAGAGLYGGVRPKRRCMPPSGAPLASSGVPLPAFRLPASSPSLSWHSRARTTSHSVGAHGGRTMIPLAAGGAREGETILFSGLRCHGFDRFARLDPPRPDRGPAEWGCGGASPLRLPSSPRPQ
jgi:hypothetical protein